MAGLAVAEVEVVVAMARTKTFLLSMEHLRVTKR
jgi:hypothetical protein